MCVCRFSTLLETSEGMQRERTWLSHTRARCHTHRLVRPAPHFSKGRKKVQGGQRALACPKSPSGRRWTGIQPHAGGSVAKHRAPPHTVGQLGTQEIDKCSPTTCQQGADDTLHLRTRAGSPHWTEGNRDLRMGRAHASHACHTAEAKPKWEGPGCPH